MDYLLTYRPIAGNIYTQSQIATTAPREQGLEMKMKTALYSAIIPAIGQTEVEVIKNAHILGYELVKFNGWDNDDLGPSGNHGPRWEEARANGKILIEIQDAFEITYADGSYDQPHIKSTAINA